MLQNAQSQKLVWFGRILSIFAVLFLFFDAIIHLLNIPPVVVASKQLGYPGNVGITLGILEIICLACYIIPKTKFLGAILLTGYLGGAVASNFRIGQPLFSITLFPVYTALFVWGGLFFRDKRLRALIPFA